MTDSNGSRTLFQTLKVPFDMKAVALAFLGLVVLWAGGALVLDPIFESVAVNSAEKEWLDHEANKEPDGEDAKKRWKERRDKTFEAIADKTEIHVIPVMVHDSLRKMKLPIRALPVIGDEIGRVVETLYGEDKFEVGYKYDRKDLRLGWLGHLIALIWWFLILAVFGGAICRVAACRIARDESIGIKAALAFSMKGIKDYLLAPVAVAAVIAFMWGCILLAGVVVSIPVVGPILSIVLYPLVIISGLIITIVGFVGVLGLLLMTAAVSAERNGALDAISRAFSYIFSRPLQFFFACFLVFLFAYIILLAGNAFVTVVADSFYTGSWSNKLDMAITSNVGFDDHTPDLDGQGFFAVAGFIIWLFHRILWWGIAGYAIYFILGGTTAAYFGLRREVDGTEESEIYLEDADEDEFDFSASEPAAPPVPPAPETPAAPEPEKKADDTLELPKEEEAAEAPEVESSDEADPDDEEKKPEGEGDA